MSATRAQLDARKAATLREELRRARERRDIAEGGLASAVIGHVVEGQLDEAVVDAAEEAFDRSRRIVGRLELALDHVTPARQYPGA